MNGPINNLLKFHFHRGPNLRSGVRLFSRREGSREKKNRDAWSQVIEDLNHRFAYHSTLNALLQVLFQVSIRSFLHAFSKFCWTLDESRGNAVPRSAKALQHFLPKTALSLPGEIQKMSFVPLLFSDKAARRYAFLYNFTEEQSHLWYAWLILLRKVPPFVIRCEDKFPKARLSSEIFECTWVKCLLETNLGQVQTPYFTCIWAGSNASEKNPLFSLICVRFGSCEARRLSELGLSF